MAIVVCLHPYPPRTPLWNVNAFCLGIIESQFLYQNLQTISPSQLALNGTRPISLRSLPLTLSPPHDYLTRSTQCNLDDSIAFLADVTILLWLCSSISSFALSLMTAKVSIHPDEGYIHDRVIETSRLHLLGIFCSREIQKHHKCWNQNCHIQNECVCVCYLSLHSPCYCGKVVR